MYVPLPDRIEVGSTVDEIHDQMWDLHEHIEALLASEWKSAAEVQQFFLEIGKLHSATVRAVKQCDPTFNKWPKVTQ